MIEDIVSSTLKFGRARWPDLHRHELFRAEGFSYHYGRRLALARSRRRCRSSSLYMFAPVVRPTARLRLCEDEPRRRAAARLLTRDEAPRIARNIAKLPDLAAVLVAFARGSALTER